MFFLSSLSAQITFNANYNPPGPQGNRPAIIVDGTQTGDDLRTFVLADPIRGVVTDNNITFNAQLVINNNAVFTDENAVYHFPGDYAYQANTNCTVNFTDVTIHYSGNQKVHSFSRAYTANFTRVFYLLGVESGRSDFFNNGNFTFNMNNVNFTSYGDNDFLHFQTNTTLNNITVVNADGGLNFEPGARVNGEVQIINNLTLEGVTRIVGGSGSQGDFRAINMDWDATNWNFSVRDVDFFFVNPVKPTGWTGYSGGATLSVQEFFTHDVTVTDESFNPLTGITVTLYNNDSGTFDYNETTDAAGEIAQQEVLTIDNTVSLNFNRGLSTLVVPDYLMNYFAATRDFNDNAVGDNVVLSVDEFITETNQAAVALYSGITIDHNLKTITVSENRTLCELYDFIKLNKINNLDQPSITEFLATPQNNILDIADYQFVLSGTAVISPCDNFLQLVSSETSSIADVNNLQVGLADAAGVYKFVSIRNLINAELLVRDITGSPVTLFSETNYTGERNIVVAPGGSATDVRIDVTRDGYTDFSVEQDISGVEDIFVFVVYQSPKESPATSENQENILFLAKKILTKNEGILQQVNGATPVVNITNVTGSSTLEATEENQQEILDLLKRILTKTTVIDKRFD